MWSDDKKILRSLANQIAEIAADPIQEKTLKLWHKHHRLEQERPMVLIDQLPWHEFNANGEMTLHTEDPFAREMEERMRKIIYKWNHFRDDFIVYPEINVPMIITGGPTMEEAFGVKTDEQTAEQGKGNTVYSHEYHDQFQTEEDLEKIKAPVIELDEAATAKREEMAHDAFDGILGVVMDGYHPAFWNADLVMIWKGAEGYLMDICDRPEYIHKMMQKLTDYTHSMLDQLEEKGLLCSPKTQVEINCAGTYNDIMAQGPDFDPKKPKCKDIWGGGMAQMLCSVSPEMHDEFDIQYSKSIYERFGYTTYGCCEPLENKIEYVKKIPNVRRVSISPWVQNRAKAAEQLGKDLIYWNKPNPSLLLDYCYDIEVVKADILDTYNTGKKYGCNMEFTLKDITTICNKPQIITEWMNMVRDLFGIETIANDKNAFNY